MKNKNIIKKTLLDKKFLIKSGPMAVESTGYWKISLLSWTISHVTFNWRQRGKTSETGKRTLIFSNHTLPCPLLSSEQFIRASPRFCSISIPYICFLFSFFFPFERVKLINQWISQPIFISKWGENGKKEMKPIRNTQLIT